MSVEFSDYKHIVYSAEDLSELIMTTSQLISRIRDKTFANFDQLKDLKVEEMGYVTIIRSFENTFSFFMTFIENCKDLKMLFENNKFTSQYINQDLNLPEAEEAKAVISEYEFNEAEHRYLQHQEKFISNYSEQNQLLIQHFKEQLQNTEDFDDSIKAKISSIGLVFYKFNEYLKAIDLNCSNIIKCLDQSKSNENIEEYLIDMFYTDSLMKHFCELLFFSAEARDNSLFFKTPEDDEWVKLQPYIEYVEIREEDEIMKSYEKFSKWVILGISTFRKFENPNDITNIEELKNNIMKIFKVGFYGSIYFLSFKKRIQQYKYFVSNPDIKIACLLWNSIDLKFFSLFYNVAIPSVKLNQILYVPRLYSLLSTSLSDGQDSLLRMNDESNHSDNEESKRSHQIEFYADSSDDSSESSFHTNKNEFNNETHMTIIIHPIFVKECCKFIQ